MKKTLSLFLALMFSVVLTAPAFADIQYADTGGNYTVITDATLKGGVVSETYRDVAVIWENRSSDGQSNGYGNSRAYQLVKADSSGYHSVSDWYQNMSGFCESGFVAAQNSDGKWGVLNASGQTVLDFKFDRISDLTDDGYALVETGNGAIVLNLKTGQEVFKNRRESTGEPPENPKETPHKTWEEFIIQPVGGCNNGLIPVMVTVMEVTYNYDATTNSGGERHQSSQSYGQYFGLDGKPAFPTKFSPSEYLDESVYTFHTGYAVIRERITSTSERSKFTNYVSKIIDAKGNVILSDHGQDFFDGSWREGESFLLSKSAYHLEGTPVSPEGIISASFFKDIRIQGTSQSYTEQSKYIDLNGNLIPALSAFTGNSFRHGYAAVQSLNKESSKIFSKRLLIDTDGNPVFAFSESSSHQLYLSDVSNTGFCWLAEEGGWGKGDGYGSDRILGVIQVPVKETPPPESAPAASAETAFSDVPADAYYADAVKWAVAQGVTNGVSATNFAPADTCTRGQVATFLWRAKGCPEPATTENPFEDVDPSSAFYKAILWAAENGVTSGTSETTFSPGNPCTRAHVVTFLWRSQGKPDASGAAPLADSFPQGYYTDAVRWADSAGLLGGTEEAFAPSALCPRADIVTYLYRVLT